MSVYTVIFTPSDQTVSAPTRSSQDEQLLLDILNEEHKCLLQVTELLTQKHDAIVRHHTKQILQILTGQSANTTQTYSYLGQTSQQKKAALYTYV